MSSAEILAHVSGARDIFRMDSPEGHGDADVEAHPGKQTDHPHEMADLKRPISGILHDMCSNSLRRPHTKLFGSRAPRTRR